MKEYSTTNITELPRRVVAHLYETPQLQNPVYKFITNSTLKLKNQKFTEVVPKSTNIIRNYPCKQEYTVDFSAMKSNQREKESQETTCPKPSLEQTLDENEMFQKLKKARDVECVKMVQASNVLKVIRKHPRKEWFDELLAEKILLETDEKCALLINKIRDVAYTEIKTPKPCHEATAILSNFEFFLKPQEVSDCKPRKYTQFFILTLSHDTDVLMSKVMVPKDDKIIFEEKFTFGNLNPDFNITAKLFKISLKTSEKRTWRTIFRKKNKMFCPMSIIYYENVSTYELKESLVLKTSFSCCGQFTLTKDQLGNSHFTISQLASDSPLQGDGNYFFQGLD